MKSAQIPNSIDLRDLKKLLDEMRSLYGQMVEERRRLVRSNRRRLNRTDRNRLQRIRIN